MKNASTPDFSSTIAAVSTPYGRGGIAVIRISGEDAVNVASRIFISAGKAEKTTEDSSQHYVKEENINYATQNKDEDTVKTRTEPKRNSRTLENIEGYRAVYGLIVFPDGEFIDDGIATVFRKPHSYTGEDTVELSCHGGVLIPEKVLAAAIAAGAEYAAAGEFTKRAFINGKISLSQAEAVIDLIDAETDEQLKLARSHKSGVFSRAVDGIYNSLLTLLSETYVVADYPDEDLRELSADEFRNRLSTAAKDVRALSDSYRIGRAVKNGIYTVVAGKPNTGKSSLLNRILGENRAIVSPIAGTTRDYIEEKAYFGGVMLRLVDTAGIRNYAGDEIEKIGIERSVSALENAELIFAMFDLSAPLDDDDILFSQNVKRYTVPKIALFNKSDVVNTEQSEVYSSLSSLFDKSIVISAETGDGIDLLESAVKELFKSGEIDYNTTAVTANARQNALLMRTSESLERALTALNEGMSADIAGLDIEEALCCLGETDGRKISEEIVDNIFHRFCVGK